MLNARSLALVGVCVALCSSVFAQQTQTNAGRPTLTTQDYIDIQQLLHKYAFALDTWCIRESAASRPIPITQGTWAATRTSM